MRFLLLPVTVFALLSGCAANESASSSDGNRVGSDSPSTPVVDDRNFGTSRAQNVN